MKKILLLLCTIIIFIAVQAQGDTWIKKMNFGGGGRIGAVGFSIGSKGYLGTGLNTVTNFYTNDFWEYDPVTWTQKQISRELQGVMALLSVFLVMDI